MPRNKDQKSSTSGPNFPPGLAVPEAGPSNGGGVGQDQVDLSSLDMQISDWCDSCKSLKQEIQRIQSEHAQNYQMLKDKIIPTDQLIRRYSTKCQEYDALNKKLEETSKSLENFKRENNALGQQLKVALEETVPLRQNLEKCEKKRDQCQRNTEQLQDKVQSLEASQKQHSLLHKNTEQELTSAKQKLQELEASQKASESTLKKLQNENKNLKSELDKNRSNSKTLKTEKTRLETRVKKLEEILARKGLLSDLKRLRPLPSASHPTTGPFDSTPSSGRSSCPSPYVSPALSPTPSDSSVFDSVLPDGLCSPVDDMPALVSPVRDNMMTSVFSELGIMDQELLRPICPALSPLPASPVVCRTQVEDSEDDGSSIHNESIEDLASMIESELLSASPKQTSPLSKPREKVCQDSRERTLSDSDESVDMNKTDNVENVSEPDRSHQGVLSSLSDDSEDSELESQGKQDTTPKRPKQSMGKVRKVRLSTSAAESSELKKRLRRVSSFPQEVDVKKLLSDKRGSQGFNFVKAGDSILNSVGACEQKSLDKDFCDMGGKSSQTDMVHTKMEQESVNMPLETCELQEPSKQDTGAESKSSRLLKKLIAKGKEKVCRRSSRQSSVQDDIIATRHTGRTKIVSSTVRKTATSNEDIENQSFESHRSLNEDTLADQEQQKCQAKQEENKINIIITEDQPSVTQEPESVVSEDESKLSAVNPGKKRLTRSLTRQDSIHDHTDSDPTGESPLKTPINTEQKIPSQPELEQPKSSDNQKQEVVTPKPEGHSPAKSESPRRKKQSPISPDSPRRITRSMLKSDTTASDLESDPKGTLTEKQVDDEKANAELPTEPVDLQEKNSLVSNHLTDEYETELKDEKNTEKELVSASVSVSKPENTPDARLEHDIKSTEVPDLVLKIDSNAEPSRLIEEPKKDRVSEEDQTHTQVTHKRSRLKSRSKSVNNPVAITTPISTGFDLNHDSIFSAFKRYTPKDKSIDDIKQLSSQTSVESLNLEAPSEERLTKQGSLGFELSLLPGLEELREKYCHKSVPEQPVVLGSKQSDEVSPGSPDQPKEPSIKPSASPVTTDLDTQEKLAIDDMDGKTCQEKSVMFSLGSLPCLQNPMIDSEEDETFVDEEPAMDTATLVPPSPTYSTFSLSDLVEEFNIDRALSPLKAATDVTDFVAEDGESLGNQPKVRRSRVKKTVPKEALHICSTAVKVSTEKRKSCVPDPAVVPVKRKRGRPKKGSLQSSIGQQVKVMADVKAKRSSVTRVTRRSASDLGTELTQLGKSKDVSQMSSSDIQALDRELQFMVRFSSMSVEDTANKIHDLHPLPTTVAAKILQILEQSQTNTLNTVATRCQNGQAPSGAPWLADHELKLVEFTWLLTQKPGMRDLKEKVLSMSKDCLLHRTPQVQGAMSVCRAYIAMCRLDGNIERAQILTYDCARLRVEHLTSLLVAVSAAWPVVLKKTPLKCLPLLDALEYIVMGCQQDCGVKHSRLHECLERLCGWSRVRSQAADLARSYMEQLKYLADNSKTAELAQYTRSLLLLSLHEGWLWTNNVLVVDLIWPELSLWVNSLSSSTSTQGHNVFIEKLITLLGEVGYHCPAESRSQVRDIMTTMRMILQGEHQSKVPEGVQNCLIQALLQLAPFHPHLTATTCMQWVNSHSVPATLRQGLQDFAHFYKSRLEYLSDFKI